MCFASTVVRQFETSKWRFQQRFVCWLQLTVHLHDLLMIALPLNRIRLASGQDTRFAESRQLDQQSVIWFATNRHCREAAKSVRCPCMTCRPYIEQNGRHKSQVKANWKRSVIWIFIAHFEINDPSLVKRNNRTVSGWWCTAEWTEQKDDLLKLTKANGNWMHRKDRMG